MSNSIQRFLCIMVISVLSIASVSFSNKAEAGLMGKPVQIDWRYFHINDVYLGFTSQFVVGPTVELTSWVGGVVDIDVTDSSIIMQVVHSANVFTGPAQIPGVMFNGFAFIDYADALPAIADVKINPITNLVGFDASRITFDANHIYANVMGLSYDPTSVLQLDISLVPEPASYSLMILGLGYITWRRFRKND